MMQKRLLIRFTAVFFAIFGPVWAQAQIVYPTDTSMVVTVLTVDGNLFVGKIASADTAMIVLKTDNEETYTIRKQTIKSLRPGIVKTSRLSRVPVPESNIHAFRYFVGPSAYGIPKGQMYYENSLLIFNQFTYGFSDHFSLGIGVAPLPMFDAVMPAWLTPKLSIPIVREKINFGLGAMYGRAFLNNESSEKQTFGAVFAQGTFGSRQRNVTGGVGISYSDDRWSPYPVLSLSGCFRATRVFYLITENYRFKSSSETTTLLSLGGRFMFWQVAIDAIFVAPFVSDDDFVPLPWVGFHLLFGKQKK